MALPRPVSPLAAWRDLRRFLAQRQKHELIFGILAIFVTGVLLIAFYLDSNSMKKPYKRDIQYVESWPLDRTDEQIHAQQKIDQAKREVEQAKMEKLKRERQAQFKKVDDELERLGL